MAASGGPRSSRQRSIDLEGLEEAIATGWLSRLVLSDEKVVVERV